jgi:hypothetical protein
LLSGLGLADAEALMIAGSTKSAFLNKPMGDPKRGPKTMQKPTNAPKRFKRYVGGGLQSLLCTLDWINGSNQDFSSFIFFSMAKHKQIKEHLVKQGDTAKVCSRYLSVWWLGILCNRLSRLFSVLIDH